MNNKSAVIFARSNHSPAHVQRQVDQLRLYAATHGYHVLGTVGLPDTSADDEQVQTSLMGLIAKSPSHAHEPTVLVADPSRLARGVTKGLYLTQRLLAAGWRVVYLDGGEPSVTSVEHFLDAQKVLGGLDAKDEKARDLADAETDDGR